MQIKTSELIGTALDYAVAVAEGGTNFLLDSERGEQIMMLTLHGKMRVLRPEYEWSYTPSTDWAHGGPIIEREMMQLYPCISDEWCCSPADGIRQHLGPTPLISAMRCYVASKLGDTVEVPDELIKE